MWRCVPRLSSAWGWNVSIRFVFWVSIHPNGSSPTWLPFTLGMFLIYLYLAYFFSSCGGGGVRVDDDEICLGVIYVLTVVSPLASTLRIRPRRACIAPWMGRPTSSWLRTANSWRKSFPSRTKFRLWRRSSSTPENRTSKESSPSVDLCGTLIFFLPYHFLISDRKRKSCPYLSFFPFPSGLNWCIWATPRLTTSTRIV